MIIQEKLLDTPQEMIDFLAKKALILLNEFVGKHSFNTEKLQNPFDPTPLFEIQSTAWNKIPTIAAANRIKPINIEIHVTNQPAYYDPLSGKITFNISLTLLQFLKKDIDKNMYEYKWENKFDRDLVIKKIFPNPSATRYVQSIFTLNYWREVVIHELSHWFRDVFGNKYISKYVGKLKGKTKQDINKYLTAKWKTDVKMSYMELDALIHEIAQYKKQHIANWDTLSMSDLVKNTSLEPVLLYALDKGEEVARNWFIRFLKRMAREDLLGKNMRKIPRDLSKLLEQYNLPKKPLLSDNTVQKILKSLQTLLKKASNHSPRAIVSFLKNRFRLSNEQIKYFIFKANQILYQTGQQDLQKQQQRAAVFQKLPPWAKWGMAHTGYNPPERLQTESLQKISYPNQYKNGKLLVFRGVGKRGKKSIKPSSEGAHGEGVYFYNNPYEARSFAGQGGGIRVGLVNKSDIKQVNTVIILSDPVKYKQIGFIPTEKTLNKSDINLELNKFHTHSFSEKKKSEYEKLKKNQVPLTPEERKEIFKKGAVWHYGYSIDPNTRKRVKKISAIWKSKDEEGNITYVTATHRAYATARSLSAIINKYHREIEPTA